MSAPARRHDAGEIPPRMASSGEYVQQLVELRAGRARPSLPPRDLDRLPTSIYLGGDQRVTSFLGHQGPVGTRGVVAPAELGQAAPRMLGILVESPIHLLGLERLVEPLQQAQLL